MCIPTGNPHIRVVRGFATRRSIGEYPSVLEKSRVYGAVNGAAVSSLSGGNQQKLYWDASWSKCLACSIAHNPFRGLDVRAIHDVRDAIFAACKAGLAS